MRYHLSALVLVTLLAVGCGGGGGNGGTTPQPVLTIFELTPSSTTIEVGGTSQLTFAARDQNGASMAGTPTFQSSDNTKATVNTSGVVTAQSVGSATITATLTIGGVTKTDATVVTVIAPGAFPLTATVSMLATTFSPEFTHIARTGIVTFSNTSAIQHNVTFAPKTGVPSNMSTCANCSEQKQFNTVDTYTFQCTIHPGMNGTVVVH